MATRNERRTGKAAKSDAPKGGPKIMKPTAANMKGSKKPASNNRGKR